MGQHLMNLRMELQDIYEDSPGLLVAVAVTEGF